MSGNTLISIRHLRKEYPNITPLKDVNCDIERGNVISIIGPSGTGKSTLLRCINRLEVPTSGEIFIDGVNILDKAADIYKIRLKMGMVFQSFNLFSHLTVMENIMLGPVNLLHVSRQDAYDEGIRLLKLVGLAEKAENYPDELSGGQKQRIAIARTLAMKPEIILFDEPTSALDPAMVGEVLSVIRNLADMGLTMLIVTHEMKFAHDVSNRVFYMDEGVIYEDGSPQQVFDNPVREKTRAFVKRLKLFERHITSKDFNFVQFSIDLAAFCRTQGISPKQEYHIQLLFEEIVRHFLLPAIEGEVDITFCLRYLEVDGTCEFVIKRDVYALKREGKQFDSLSKMIIEKVAKDLKIEPDKISCII